MHHTLYIKNELCELSRVFEFIERNLPSCLSDKRKLSQVKLAIEELVANVIMYAYGERKDQDIQIEMECRGTLLQVTVIDSGIPFNPLESKDPDLSLSVEERPIGGLGIFLVKQLMTELRYERASGKNVLTMIKDLG